MASRPVRSIPARTSVIVLSAVKPLWIGYWAVGMLPTVGAGPRWCGRGSAGRAGLEHGRHVQVLVQEAVLAHEADRVLQLIAGQRGRERVERHDRGDAGLGRG